MSTGPEDRRYQVEFTRPALKEFRDLSREAQQRIAPHITDLSQNPRPQGVEKLQGQDDQYRIRVGNYRVYTILDGRLIVTVVRVADLKDVYRP